MADIWVDLNGERFIVQFSPEGEATNIKQRKKWAAGMPWECWHNASYWHHSHKLTPKPARIIEAAKEKMNAAAA